MKKKIVFFAFFSFLLLLSSCESSGNRFKLSGRLLNFNQGMFLLYSLDGSLTEIDTVIVEGGRFLWETECEEPSIYILVLPNYSEQPIFAQKNCEVTIKGDASKLKEIEIKGTKDNDLMTAFRKQIMNVTPPEIISLASDFIRAHPETLVAKYLLFHYFIDKVDGNYTKASELIDIISEHQEKNSNFQKLKLQLSTRVKVSSDTHLPKFRAIDMNGKSIVSEDLNDGVTLIYTWASWNYESHNMQRRVNSLLSDSGGKLKLLGINLDASRLDCQDVIDREGIKARQISDGLMFESPLFTTLGFSSVPDNIILVDGKIVARSIDSHQLEEKLKKELRI